MLTTQRFIFRVHRKILTPALQKVSEDLRLIASWCCTNKLLINPDKTKLILFGTKQLKVPDISLRYLISESPFLGNN